MVDITHKANTLRVATAQAVVKVGSKATIVAIKENMVPKGNVFEMSKAAGLLGVKNTPLILPDCHPLPIEATKIDYEVEGLEIKIIVTVKTIYKTGVEVEAMHGASVIALNMYDMLKPIDKNVEIHQIKLLKKTGGKSDVLTQEKNSLSAAIVICSDSISKGINKDKTGVALKEKLQQLHIKVQDFVVIPDNIEEIQKQAIGFQSKGTDIIIFSGGTGLSPNDVTPEALEVIIDRRIPGIEEVIRNYGQQRTPFSMLSRSIAGMIKNSLVVAVPGSVKGATESLDAIFPAAKHIFKVIEGQRHD
jgi:molybdenum cofactor biosynthesis protein MoaC